GRIEDFYPHELALSKVKVDHPLRPRRAAGGRTGDSVSARHLGFVRQVDVRGVRIAVVGHSHAEIIAGGDARRCRYVPLRGRPTEGSGSNWRASSVLTPNRDRPLPWPTN